jgi:hypothetical protein
MKQKMLGVGIALLLATIQVAPALAAQGGTPGAHGLTGREFGAAVSALATSAPGAVADHVSNGSSGGGVPAAHGMSGRDFGAAVSALAQSAPAAVAEHVSGK